mmetsp:Transcript_52500/g.72792  ORF Transcript_52500/g.72792 Transcript_52500/m.72792 type:complete len:263 (+) Transcript_52500:216-1004(+)
MIALLSACLSMQYEIHKINGVRSTRAPRTPLEETFRNAFGASRGIEHHASANTVLCSWAWLRLDERSAQIGREIRKVVVRVRKSRSATPVEHGNRAYSKPGSAPFVRAFSTYKAQRAPAGGKKPAFGFKIIEKPAQNMTTVRSAVGLSPNSWAATTVQTQADMTPAQASRNLSMMFLRHHKVPSLAARIDSAAKISATAPKGGTQSVFFVTSCSSDIMQVELAATKAVTRPSVHSPPKSRCSGGPSRPGSRCTRPNSLDGWR